MIPAYCQLILTCFYSVKKCLWKPFLYCKDHQQGAPRKQKIKWHRANIIFHSRHGVINSRWRRRSLRIWNSDSRRTGCYACCKTGDSIFFTSLRTMEYRFCFLFEFQQYKQVCHQQCLNDRLLFFHGFKWIEWMTWTKQRDSSDVALSSPLRSQAGIQRRRFLSQVFFFVTQRDSGF